MKYVRAFSKKIKGGILVYNSRPNLPIPFRVKSIIISVESIPGDGPYPFTLTDYEEALVTGEVSPCIPIKFDPPLKVQRGKHEFRVSISGLSDLVELSGQIEIEYSILPF